MKTKRTIARLGLLLILTVCFLIGKAQPYPNIGDQWVCLNSTQPYGVINTVGSTYAWTIIPLTGGNGTITGNGNSSISILWNSVGTATLQVIETQAAGCVGLPVTITVTVNPRPIPTIAGPTPVCLNSAGNVYTTESGMSNYVWTITGGTITAGQGTGGISVTWTSTGVQTLTVTYTNSNGCDPLTPTTFNVTVNPLPVPTLSGPTPVCQNSPGHVYTTESGMTNYVWNVVGGTITAGGTATDNTVTITWNIVSTETVSVNYTNADGCTAASPTIFNVIVDPLPVPTIAGPTPVCENSTGNVYTTEAGMTNYIWNIVGGIITAGGALTDNTVTVTWTTVGAETVSLNYTNVNGCTAASPTIFNVTVNALPVPTITGPTPVCQNSTGNVYTTEAGMTNYIWNIVGGTITAGGTATDNTVTVTWTTVGPGSVSVNYNNGPGCTAASPIIFNVIVHPLPVPTLAGPTPVCQNSTGNVYTTEPGMTNYVWNIVGGTITAGGAATDNSVTIIWTVVGTGTVSVNYNDANGCTAASPTIFNVVVNPLPVPTITGPTPVCLNSTGNIYTTEAGMTGYAWTVTGGTIDLGQGTSSISVTWTAVGPQTLTVTYTNVNGCNPTTPTPYTVTVNLLPVTSPIYHN